ncbi:hypothetical protein M3D75_07290 [Microbacterium enclense]|uniref:hypothetical protein n=1 Tax=Microbacterium enclense TaxID=993073 RepID=UPI0021A4510D|nr:hypothetical protein [Microbacterium enclense]MCT2085912.1 hypothetical protein [Microbacterium enclense]
MARDNITLTALTTDGGSPLSAPRTSISTIETTASRRIPTPHHIMKRSHRVESIEVVDRREALTGTP